MIKLFLNLSGMRALTWVYFYKSYKKRFNNKKGNRVPKLRFSKFTNHLYNTFITNQIKNLPFSKKILEGKKSMIKMFKYIIKSDSKNKNQ